MQGLPSEFPLTSTNPGIVRHLSGLSGHAHTRNTYVRGDRWAHPPDLRPERQNHGIYFHFALLDTPSCTCMYAELLGPCFKTGRA
jgi:hypothetical protein